MLVRFVLVPGMLVMMRRRCIRLVVVAMGAAVSAMGMVMIVLEGMRVTVVVVMAMSMFLVAMFVAVLVLMIVVMVVGVVMGVFALAHLILLEVKFVCSRDQFLDTRMHRKGRVQAPFTNLLMRRKGDLYRFHLELPNTSREGRSQEHKIRYTSRGRDTSTTYHRWSHLG